MDITLSEEQSLFRDSVERFVTEEYAFDQRQKIVIQASGFLDEHWRSFAELGWLAAPFPEDYGGLGGSPWETMVLMEQFGRGLVASPYLASVVLGGQLVLCAGSEDQKQAILPAVGGGELRLALAYAEPQSRYDLADVATTAKPAGDGYLIEGAKSVVFYGAAADKLLVTARSSGEQRDEAGISIFLVDAEAPGIEASHYRTQDGGRASDVRFAGLEVGPEALVGELGKGYPALERTVDYAIAAVCAEASGAMWAIYEQTLAYLKTRQQFGQTLGSFQALQHRMVDVFMKCQLAQSMVYEATDSLQQPEAAARRRAASAAKYEIGRYGREVGQEGIQLHGGMGMMTELPIGHYFKRLTAINTSFGDASHHLSRYANTNL